MYSLFQLVTCSLKTSPHEVRVLWDIIKHKEGGLFHEEFTVHDGADGLLSMEEKIRRHGAAEVLGLKVLEKENRKLEQLVSL